MTRTFLGGMYGYTYGYGYAYGLMAVEMNAIDDAVNIHTPESVFNYQISPVRNLMRWFRTMAASYPNINDSDNKLSFNAGTGNLQATGMYRGRDECREEALPIKESQDITPQNFQDVNKCTPLWSNETFSFEYPMSVAEYNNIKANPYGYVSFQCGDGDFERGWIKDIKYRPVDGKATIVLRLLWNPKAPLPLPPLLPPPDATVDDENALAWDVEQTQAQAWDTGQSQALTWSN
jgi:hypothetical protein